MIIRAYVVDHYTKERLKSYKRKSKYFTAEIIGKKFCKKHGPRVLEIVSIGDVVKTSQAVYIDKDTNLRFHFDSD